MTVRLLCIGDIHLGRRPARLPAEVVERVGLQALTPAAAWRRAVEEALRLRVDAVLLAGDVVEQNDDFYEAYGDLAQGVERLVAAGIGVLGVAGNHDVEVLPRLAGAIEGFRLLGRGGTWEAAAVSGSGGDGVEVIGWSFPQALVRSSPLETFPRKRAGGWPLLGLLHCDRDQGASHYAPVRSAELEAAPVDAWLLGHIHRPDALAGGRPVGYLGSLCGLDPGEPGAHGPWLLETGAGGELDLHQLPLAPLRWEPLEVSVADLDVPEDIHARITARIDELHASLANTGYRPRAVGCRIRLVGRTPHRRALGRLLAADEPEGYLRERDEVAYFIERVRLEALPAVDLDTLAQGGDPAALLARKLLVLRRNAEDPERRRLIEDAHRRLAGVAGQPAWTLLDAAPPDEARVAEILETAALRALDELLAQREALA